MSAREWAATAINGLVTAGSVWAIGHLVRGPQARPSVPRDLGVGALVLGGVLVTGWANSAARS